ncbi:MAG: hypothetical protein QOI28_3942 [Mycobacterium sp.]|nr:hypothetical protein [Mycobacterium sp.]
MKHLDLQLNAPRLLVSAASDRMSGDLAPGPHPVDLQTEILSSATFLAVNLFIGESTQAFLDYGWRIPFLASAFLVIIGLYVRIKVEETSMFTRQSTIKPMADQRPFVSVLKHQPSRTVPGRRRCWRVPVIESIRI